MKYKGKPSRLKTILKPNTWFVMTKADPGPINRHGSFQIPHTYSFDLIRVEGKTNVKDEKSYG